MEGGKYILECGWLKDKPITHISNKTSLKLLNEILIAKGCNVPVPDQDRWKKKEEEEKETLQKRKKLIIATSPITTPLWMTLTTEMFELYYTTNFAWH